MLIKRKLCFVWCSRLLPISFRLRPVSVRLVASRSRLCCGSSVDPPSFVQGLPPRIFENHTLSIFTAMVLSQVQSGNVSSCGMHELSERRPRRMRDEKIGIQNWSGGWQQLRLLGCSGCGCNNMVGCANMVLFFDKDYEVRPQPPSSSMYPSPSSAFPPTPISVPPFHSESPCRRPYSRLLPDESPRRRPCSHPSTPYPAPTIISRLPICVYLIRHLWLITQAIHGIALIIAGGR